MIVPAPEQRGPEPPEAIGPALHAWLEVKLGLSPIVTSQYSSTALYQISYHIQSLFF